MGLWGWFKGLFRRKPEIMDQLPEVLGHITDAEGQRHAIHRGPIQQESLSPDQLQRVARLRDVLAEAYPMTLDGWVDGFLRDADPESEIRIIEGCAVVYQQLGAQAALSAEDKKGLYSVLCIISAGGGGPELADALPAGKGLPDLEKIIGMYRQARLAGSRP
jgi:hypothetical protein